MKQKGMNVKKRLVKKGKLSREEERQEGGSKQSALDTSMKLSKINSIKKSMKKLMISGANYIKISVVKMVEI